MDAPFALSPRDERRSRGEHSSSLDIPRLLQTVATTHLPHDNARSLSITVGVQ